VVPYKQHSAQLIMSLRIAAVMGALLLRKPASTRNYSPYFPCNSIYLSSYISLQLVTYSSWVCQMPSENISQYKIERLSWHTSHFSSDIISQFLQRRWTIHMNSIFQGHPQTIVTPLKKNHIASVISHSMNMSCKAATEKFSYEPWNFPTRSKHTPFLILSLSKE